MKEVVVSLGTAEPTLLALFGNDPPLDRRLQLRELQANYVYSAVMAKKYRVCPLGLPSGFRSGVSSDV